MRWRSAGRGWEKASFDSTQASSASVASEVKVSLPPMVTPHSPRFTEYAPPKGGIGKW